VRGRHAWDKRSESDLHDAIRFFQDSIDADPTYAPAYAGLADAYAQLGYGSYVSPEDTFPRARTAAEKALDPLSPAINTDRAYISYYYGRNEDALHSVGLALEMNPTFALGYFWLGRIYTSQGRYADADQAFHNIGPLRTWTPAMAALGYMYGRAGRAQEAKAILAEFDGMTQHGRHASAYAIAAIYAGLRDREQMFRYLDAAYREHSHWLLWLKRDPRWDEFRADPRFENLVKKVGLPS
jgi:tetratricopeptide (TPR) repeat protein